MHNKAKFILLIFLLSLFTVSCRNNKTPLFKKDESSKAEKKNNLFVFVGEKIEVKELPHDTDSWDGKLSAKYKILQRVYGNFDGDTIEFTAYDHYGAPPFSRYKNAMLFVSKHKDKYFHEKYQFYDVYKTKDNRWAGRYSVRDLGYDNKRNKNVSAHKIDFLEEVSITLDSVNKKEIGCWFPEPYYKIEKDKAVAVYGIYIEELFKIKKEGVLTARGLFGNGEPGELEIIDTDIAEIRTDEAPTENDWKNFELFWNKTKNELDSSIGQRLNDVSLDSIFLNDTLYSKHNSRIKETYSIEALKQLKSSNDLDYRNIEIGKGKPFFRATIIVDTINTFETKLQASFVKTKTGFKLYSIKEEKKCICWQ